MIPTVTFLYLENSLERFLFVQKPPLPYTTLFAKLQSGCLRDAPGRPGGFTG
jgi:hypothetical protein